MTLDEAWAEVMAALPEGWVLDALTSHQFMQEWRATAITAKGSVTTVASSPAAALHALAAHLRRVSEDVARYTPEELVVIAEQSGIAVQRG